MERAYFIISNWRCSCGQFNNVREQGFISSDKASYLECKRCHTAWEIEVTECKEGALERARLKLEKRKAG